MSVLIKGMKMPTNCDDCDFVQHSYPEDWCYLTEKNLPCNCPIIELPPHGRLIDADALEKMGYKLVRDIYRDGRWMWEQAFLDVAPTILEAEVKEWQR